MFKYLLIILLLFPSIYLKSEFNTKISIKNIEKEIPDPTLANGLFFEYLLDWMYGPFGIWAQEFNDRGFDLKSDNHLKHWRISKGIPAGDYLKEGGYNENGLFYVSLSTSLSIQQRVYVYESEKYEFYIYGRCESSQNLEVSFTSENSQQEFFTRTIKINSPEWKKYKFELEIPESTHRVDVKISNINSNDPIEIDEVSLVPDNNVLGIREEFHELIMKMKPGIIRYPGGGFADQINNNWRLAIGDIDKRLSPNVDFRGNMQRMDFGYIEYFNYCNYINAEPYIVVNYLFGFEDGINQNAYDLLEFCNGENSSKYGKLRKDMSGLDPQNVKYWELGNEMFYFMDIKTYTDRFKVMKTKMDELPDPNRQYITNGDYWRWKVFFDSIMIEKEDYFQIYGYHPSFGYVEDPKGTEFEYHIMQATSPNHLFEAYTFECEEWKENYNTDIIQASTEWWSYFDPGASWQDTARANNSILSALGNTSMLIHYKKYPELIDFATRTLQLGMIDKYVNSEGKRIFEPNANLDAMSLVTLHSGNQIHNYDIDTESLFYQNDSLWMRKPVDIVDAFVTSDEDSLYITLINRHPYESSPTTIQFNNLNLENVAMYYSLQAENLHSYRRKENTKDIYFDNRFLQDINQIILNPNSINTLSIKFNNPDSVNDFIEMNYVNNGILHSQDLIGEKALIFDISGRFIGDLIIKSDSESLNFLNTGVYFLNFENVENSKTIKFIIQE